MKKTRLFHTIVVIGAALGAAAPLAATAVGCSDGGVPGEDSFWQPIAPPDMAHADLTRPPDLRTWVIIDASISIDLPPDLARGD
jgi:hypothetical protein